MEVEFKLRIEIYETDVDEAVVFEAKCYNSAECPRAKPFRDDNGDLKEDASQDIGNLIGWWFILRGDKELSKPLRCLKSKKASPLKFPTKGNISVSLFTSSTKTPCFVLPQASYDLGVSELSNAIFHVDKRRTEHSEKPTDFLILRIQNGELYCARLFVPLEQLPTEFVNDDIQEQAEEERRNRFRRVIEEIIQPKSLSKEELKYQLKLRGLTTNGTKEELTERLENCLRRKTSEEDTKRIIEAQKRAEKRGTPFEKNIRPPRRKNTNKLESLKTIRNEERTTDKKEEVNESPSAIEKIQQEYERLEPLLATPGMELQNEASDTEETQPDSSFLFKQLNFSPQKQIPLPTIEISEHKAEVAIEQKSPLLPQPEIRIEPIKKAHFAEPVADKEAPVLKEPPLSSSRPPKTPLSATNKPPHDKEKDFLDKVQNASPTELRKALFQLSKQSPLRIRILEMLQTSKNQLSPQAPITPINRTPSAKKSKTPRKSLVPSAVNKGNVSSLFSGESFAIPKLKRAAEEELSTPSKSSRKGNVENENPNT